jgi:hypothetical protein
MPKKKKMSNTEVLALVERESAWANLVNWKLLKPTNIADPALATKWKEYMNCYKVLLKIEEELVKIANDKDQHKPTPPSTCGCANGCKAWDCSNL